MTEKVRAEYSAIENAAAWGQFFQEIRLESSNFPYEFTEAKKVSNKKFNRYQDVSPYDHSRIILKHSATDYINASLVPVEKAGRKYILAQGPLPHTTSHFWLMIWQQDSRAIVMLNRVIEKNIVKCHQYWPLPGEDSYVFNDVGLKVTNVSQEEASYYTITTLKLENTETESSREVLHFHYTTWPDFGCPQSPTAFLRFLQLVRDSGVLDNSDQPAVVHCSAGIGRSGTFCLVDSCLRLIKDMGLDNIVVRDILLTMRHSRMGLVQTPAQLRFSYLAILEGLQEIPANGIVIEDAVEEEEAPPLPPPRNESLRREEGAETGDILNRCRLRDERQEKLANKIKEVKEKMRETENRSGASSLMPWGFIVAAAVGAFAFYSMYRG